MSVYATDNGHRLAKLLRPALADRTFALVLVSPLLRARETCELAGVAGAIVDPDLVEWDYGEYEGLTNVLDHDRGIPALKTWNAPVVDSVSAGSPGRPARTER